MKFAILIAVLLVPGVARAQDAPAKKTEAKVATKAKAKAKAKAKTKRKVRIRSSVTVLDPKAPLADFLKRLRTAKPGKKGAKRGSKTLLLRPKPDRKVDGRGGKRKVEGVEEARKAERKKRREARKQKREAKRRAKKPGPKKK